MTDITPAVIRPYRLGDRDALAEICVRTAARGGDCRGIYSSDDLMPEVFALPYVDAAPDLAWTVVVPGGTVEPGDERMAVDDGRAVGYVVAVADTRAFVAWWEREWAPGFVERHPAPGPPTGHDPSFTEAALVKSGADPSRMVTGITPEELDAYPAHLHIDLMPEAQRQGLGSRLLDTLRAALAERGVPGVHLSMDPANVNARAFYDRYGFVEMPSHRPDVPLLGIKTT
ncbi:GNAT family N-acetyltransferase [Antribacter gilvus]|uniref:GNAT family N-acetyltransferase n=1 Tax=Antribacter gilvus TaxID=2304675 RepID=UPI000F77F17D|nr:GNAT family N-acetyltransferase [Antribacter gilvus]